MGSSQKPGVRKDEHLDEKIDRANQQEDPSRTIVMSTTGLHKNLKALMERKGVSLKFLCKELSIPKSTLSSYLADERASYSPKHLVKLSEYFQCSIDYLLTGKATSNLELATGQLEQLFDGYLKVRIERVVQRKDDK